jgi:hypothetical protein
MKDTNKTVGSAVVADVRLPLSDLYVDNVLVGQVKCCTKAGKLYMTVKQFMEDQEVARLLIFVKLDYLRKVVRVSDWLRSISEAMAIVLEIHAQWSIAHRQVFGEGQGVLSNKHFANRFCDHYKLKPVERVSVQEWRSSIAGADMAFDLQIVDRQVSIFADRQVVCSFGTASVFLPM